MTDRPHDQDADDPATEPEDRGPAVDEATPEQPVIQRSGTPLVDDGADASDTGVPNNS